MPLKDQIYADIIVSMKAGDTLRTDSLKMIKAEIMKLEVSGKDIKATDDDVQQILKRAIKQRNEAAEGFEKGGNQLSADKERKEAEIYTAYLPAQMSEEEIKAIVSQTKTELSASGPVDLGKLMGAVMAKVKGKADGGTVNRLVKESLS